MLSSETRDRTSRLLNRLFLISGFFLMVCLMLEFGMRLNTYNWYWVRRVEVICLGLIGLGLSVRLLMHKFEFRSILAILEIVMVMTLFVWAFMLGAGWATKNEAVSYARNIFLIYLSVRLVLIVFSGLESGIDAGMRPAWIMLGSYIGLIIAGTILLQMPNAFCAKAKPWTVTQSLVAATGAVSGTAISVRDIGPDLTMRGQLVIFTLIQIGGLGLTTFVLFATYVKQHNLQVKQIVALREMLNLDMVGNLGRFLIFVLASTVLLEISGAAVLYWQNWHAELPAKERLWWCVFHSVSSFCNNGYALASDSMMSDVHSPLSLTTISAISILGGLGFPVLYDLGHNLMERIRSPFHRRKTTSVLRLSVHSQIVLVASAILFAAGTLLFLVFEWNFALKDLSFVDAIFNSYFQSCSARSVGFNSLDTTTLQDSTYMLLMLLMAVGAGPVSTGGGIKVTTLVVVILAVRSYLRNRDSIEIAHRELPPSATVISLSLLILFAMLVVIFSTVLMITQDHVSFRDSVFDIVSVMGSVGLSTGAFKRFNDFGLIVFSMASLVGRLGPLTLLLVVANRESSQRCHYPKEGILLS